MAMPEGYFDYTQRAKGLDHKLFPMRYLKDAAPLSWGQEKTVALWLTVGVDWFPMDMPKAPFVPVGGLARSYPDYWNYTTRDYGNRVGIYRLMSLFERHGVRPTAFVNTAVCGRYPVLIRDILAKQWEIAAGGVDMGSLHTGGMDQHTESGLIDQAVTTVAEAIGRMPKGWQSPAFSESENTPALLAKRGISYVCDWVNDDMPYAMTTDGGPLVTLPAQYELSDKRILFEQNQSLSSFESQVLSAYRALKAEASAENGRILSISLSPWVIGQPYRIQALSRLLTALLEDPCVVPMTGEEIHTVFSNQHRTGSAQ